MKKLYIDRVTVSGYTYLIAVGDHGLAFVGSHNSEDELHHFIPNAQFLKDPAKTAPYKTALKNLLLGKSQQFTLPIEFEGTPFQNAVWHALQTIPYGKTTTYSALAEKIGRPTATRAVANAVGRNPNQIVVPCHRVLRKDGSLGGYHGGLPLKRDLLALEARVKNA
ncbi:Methylated-DNA--protein-cysteine methyltransferase [Pediococcus damnosus]|uniref:methylated-DNA--[protein]-cysteine S-methyltransferase n=1 Tax=Pediococcus damnosus TaxID=51663 RepID=A0A143AFY8_9LACO|nr:methylated-DNA--[protein]-cysteine S-methyltransferase [Pediococcus damnosus]AMV60467.1 Methylated-DNA--protein-cysteine methyltransferase [Pediococcus damnosus]AMV63136.1 Methylated-DNA--protein-cysteine methyltransferase [Pediococcus damnosus]AMV64718.1 Methylated-DNA--protein-cysteine methyltransferase [Pediococcus damnosus]AMV66972.1 Methylated-DNA--protein-cysteine methyltransferase [Pediococcus damnosus]KJU73771.1 cysteine methyltransferase [Pediococcus damnosus LMG 28219]